MKSIDYNSNKSGFILYKVALFLFFFKIYVTLFYTLIFFFIFVYLYVYINSSFYLIINVC